MLCCMCFFLNCSATTGIYPRTPSFPTRRSSVLEVVRRPCSSRCRDRRSPGDGGDDRRGRPGFRSNVRMAHSQQARLRLSVIEWRVRLPLAANLDVLHHFTTETVESRPETRTIRPRQQFLPPPRPPRARTATGTSPPTFPPPPQAHPQ